MWLLLQHLDMKKEEAKHKNQLFSIQRQSKYPALTLKLGLGDFLFWPSVQF